MTIKTLCEVCGKTVRYTDPEEQVAQTIYDPYQFCRGHIAEPTWEALRTIMKILKTTGKNPNNRFFISKETGSYIGSAYLNTKDGLAEDIDRQCKMIREYGQRLKNKRDEKKEMDKNVIK